MFPEGITKKASAGYLYPIVGFCILGGDLMTADAFKRKLFFDNKGFQCKGECSYVHPPLYY